MNGSPHQTWLWSGQVRYTPQHKTKSDVNYVVPVLLQIDSISVRNQVQYDQEQDPYPERSTNYWFRYSSSSHEKTFWYRTQLSINSLRHLINIDNTWTCWIHTTEASPLLSRLWECIIRLLHFTNYYNENEFFSHRVGSFCHRRQRICDYHLLWQRVYTNSWWHLHRHKSLSQDCLGLHVQFHLDTCLWLVVAMILCDEKFWLHRNCQNNFTQTRLWWGDIRQPMLCAFERCIPIYWRRVSQGNTSDSAEKGITS